MIESYRFGNIRIKGNNYDKDLKIVEGEVKPNWWRKEGHRLYPEDIEDILKAKPEILVVGKGAYGCMEVTPQTKKALQERGIELMETESEKACNHYNECLRSGRRVAFACHLTC